MTQTLIQIFAKPPVAGKVKTRLIPELGIQTATAIYQYCLKSNLEMLDKSEFDVQVWLTEPSDHELFKRQQNFIQQGQDLGQRMYHALSFSLKQQPFQKVILIGSDCIELTHKILRRVEHKLSQFDLVIIPALDGGYVLIAAHFSIDKRLFENISWSTENVLSETLDIAMNLGISTSVLNPLRDIDQIQDVKHYAELLPFLNIQSTGKF